MKNLSVALAAGIVLGCFSLFSFSYVAPFVVAFGYSWSWIFNLTWIGVVTVLTVLIFYWDEWRTRNHVPQTPEEREAQQRGSTGPLF